MPTPHSFAPAGPLDAVVQALGQVVLGKEAQIRQALICLLAQGHLLIEDVPGVGKTTLAHGLARTLGFAFGRVQFTADLMPSDLTGVSVFKRATDGFVFQPGPLFNQVVLADEINRASPRTQSALLEAMEEQQITVDGATYPLPQPFFVIATQNPADHGGTYALPESQLDRFMMRLSLGYPSRHAERQMLMNDGSRDALAQLPVMMDAAQWQDLQKQVQAVHLAAPLMDYLQNLVDETRSGRWFTVGLSPRAALSVLRAAKASACLDGRSHALPDDVQAVFDACTAHRLQPVRESGRRAADQVRAMMQSLPAVS